MSQAPKAARQVDWKSTTINQCQVCTVLLTRKGEHCHSNTTQCLASSKIKLLQKAKDPVAKGCLVHIAGVDVIKIHFPPSPVQLLLWKAAHFSCLLQLGLIEFLNLSISCLSDSLADQVGYREDSQRLQKLLLFSDTPSPSPASSYIVVHVLSFYPNRICF